ncbi:MAG TPA: Gfo/Idh/MocA family oxidoreductase [Cyclobacteriaceae bacterium]|nr:Gfo/Idh/MocA family oxidoreductase [Cyclobacteriaceae bacterium]
MNTLKFAVVGAGEFAFFAVTEFVRVPGVKLVGVYDEQKENSLKFKTIDAQIKIYTSLESLCAENDIDLVYIATPPYLHYEQSKSALLSGKHVICEKPAAIKLEHAIELRKIANERGLLFVVNLMQRYNFLYDVVKEIIDQMMLGEFLHGFFENYASDEALGVTHWFWDREKSGGIFIEHGVHFFDMFSGWLGEGSIVASQKLNRPGYPHIIDKVHATALYNGGLVNFYHAFDQPKRMDRQEMRLQFERGELTLYEWVPTRLRMIALCTETELTFFRTKFPRGNISFKQSFAEPQIVRGRFKPFTFNYKLSLDTGDDVEKQDMYQNLIRSMLQDQLTWIYNRGHMRKVTGDNAVASLKLAEDAELRATVLQARNATMTVTHE